MLYVLLSPVLASPPPATDMETVQILDLAKLTIEQARSLEGKAVRVSFSVRHVTVVGDELYVQAEGPLRQSIAVFYDATRVSPLALRAKPRQTAEGWLHTTVFAGYVHDGSYVPDYALIQVIEARPISH